MDILQFDDQYLNAVEGYSNAGGAGAVAAACTSQCSANFLIPIVGPALYSKCMNKCVSEMASKAGSGSSSNTSGDIPPGPVANILEDYYRETGKRLSIDPATGKPSIVPETADMGESQAGFGGKTLIYVLGAALLIGGGVWAFGKLNKKG